MIDTLEIWCKYDPEAGGPHNGSSESEWKALKGDRATLEVAGGALKLFVTEDAGNLSDSLQERGRIRATIQVPALLGLQSPNNLWKHFHQLSKSLNGLFDTWWWGEHPSFLTWMVARLDASYDFRLPLGIDPQDIIRQLHQVEPPGFVPDLIGKRGSNTALWFSQGRKGRPANNPDILRVYDKQRQLKDVGASPEVVEAFRGVLRMEYEVKDEHGVMQRILKRGSDEPVMLYEILYPLKIYRILQRATKLLCLDDLNSSPVDAREILRAKAGKRWRTLYKHWLWMLVHGEDDWKRTHSQPLFSIIRDELSEVGLYPVISEHFPVKIQLPFAPALAEKRWLTKQVPCSRIRETKYQ